MVIPYRHRNCINRVHSSTLYNCSLAIFTDAAHGCSILPRRFVHTTAKGAGSWPSMRYVTSKMCSHIFDPYGRSFHMKHDTGGSAEIALSVMQKHSSQSMDSIQGKFSCGMAPRVLGWQIVLRAALLEHWRGSANSNRRKAPP